MVSELSLIFCKNASDASSSEHLYLNYICLVLCDEQGMHVPLLFQEMWFMVLYCTGMAKWASKLSQEEASLGAVQGWAPDLVNYFTLKEWPRQKWNLCPACDLATLLRASPKHELNSWHCLSTYSGIFPSHSLSSTCTWCSWLVLGAW